MRFIALLLAVLLSAQIAFAQESQQDIATRIVREQEEIRLKAVNKVMGAHDRAWDPTDRNPTNETAPDPAPATPTKPVRQVPTGGGFPWVLLACLLPLIPLLLLGWGKWRGTGRVRR